MASPSSPRLEIEYCVGCRWLLRAAWTAQELLTTFEAELGEVALVPGRTSGVFAVRLEGETLFDRGEAGRFPELRELKQSVRDRLAPARSLGHSDRPSAHSGQGAGAAPGTEDEAARQRDLAGPDAARAGSTAGERET